jgi:hypothetical protein|tara:strand:+ start:40 stop:468 length:429 start_codon:yes stop_codon:yes gene_type:complete
MDLNFENKVKSELDRITLKSQKLEFSMIDDFKKLFTEAKGMDKVLTKRVATLRNEYLDARGLAMKMEDTYKTAELDVADMKDLVKRIEKTTIKLIASAKELGIDPKSIEGVSEVVKIVESLEDDIDTFEKQENDYKQMINAI